MKFIFLDDLHSIYKKLNFKNTNRLEKEFFHNLNLDINYINTMPDNNLEIACDFILLNYEEAKFENSEAYFKNKDRWWVFALTGSGDMWAMRTEKNKHEVAFINHDEEKNTKPYIMNIDYNAWLQLADVASQFEKLVETQPELFDKTFSPQKVLRDEFYSTLELISQGLSATYPFDI